jgi:hypothetical protein
LSFVNALPEASATIAGDRPLRCGSPFKNQIRDASKMNKKEVQ